jgi:hypothetical protein
MGSAKELLLSEPHPVLPIHQGDRVHQDQAGNNPP